MSAVVSSPSAIRPVDKTGTSNVEFQTIARMTSPTLALFGSGPGIGISIAKAFALKHFDRIAICARNADRLASEKKEVEDAAKAAGRSVEVFTFPTDLSDVESLRKTLKEVEKLGPLGMVYHNAATVRVGDPLSETIEEVEHDFKTGNLAVYILAQWAVPLLKESGHPSPSFFVTNSHLPETPMPFLVSLSMSKGSQQNFVLNLHEAFGKDIHFGLVKVCGVVAPENAQLNPINIANKAVTLYEQDKNGWETMTFIKE